MNENKITNPDRLGWLTLFVSTGTLICCALPILLVALGFGSVVAAITSRYPLLVTLSEYEGWMFGISAGLLGLTAWYIWGRKAQCPAEPELAKLCERSRVINQWVFTLAIFIIRSEHHEIFMLFVQTKIAGNSGFFSATCDGTG